MGIAEIYTIKYEGSVYIYKSENNIFVSSQISLLNKLKLSTLKIKALMILEKKIKVKVINIANISSVKIILKVVKFVTLYFFNKKGLL